MGRAWVWMRLEVGADSLVYACRHQGAFHITNHGVPPSLLASLRRVDLSFFSDTPIPDKLRYSCSIVVASEGYDNKMLATTTTITFKDVEDDARVLPLLPPMLSQFVAEAQWLLPYLQKLATPNIAAGGGAALLFLICRALGRDDGTAGWLLGVVRDLKLSHLPPIATVPLGTWNNLPFAFGWGKKNPGTDEHAVKSFLDQVMNAKEMKIDK
ncbi:hypothetical protein JHK82_018446 [Glycine max]|nr:hypothetical protein JHK82_018446 [Glycine max]